MLSVALLLYPGLDWCPIVRAEVEFYNRMVSIVTEFNTRIIIIIFILLLFILTELYVS